MTGKTGLSPYQEELIKELNEIKQENLSIRNLDYFINKTFKYFNGRRKTKVRPEVAVIGTSIPEEILFAAGITPYWIIGGIHKMMDEVDEMVPRDTDPVSRSILGYIESQKTADFTDTLFIIPAVSDSMRKIAYQLKSEGRKIYLMDIPPEKHNPEAWDKCTELIEEVCDEIYSHSGKVFSTRKYFEAAEMVNEARLQLARFLKRTNIYPGIVTSRAKMLVQNSYYFTNDLVEWTHNLEALNDELKTFARFFSANTNVKDVFVDTCNLKNLICKTNRTPRVLLIGSPIYFPNYKVPKLIEDAGMVICDVIENSTQKLKGKTFDPVRRSRKSVIKGIAEKWFRNDCSSAFAINREMLKGLKQAVSNMKPDGVVCHILKGQIEYDFELIRMEKELEKWDIPVFRLETDYKYNDVEQLRIRMEAFAEMLGRNNALNES